MIANSVMPGVVGFDLKNTIDTSYSEPSFSPIDSFIYNGQEINKLFTPIPSQVLGNLIVLGYISAIESYFRAIIRRLIIIDTISCQACENKSLLYGAAISHEPEMLPEALFDDASFAGKSNIINSFKNFLGFNFQESSFPADLQTTLNQFNEICQLRHCIVHRFGKFGSKNAILLGLNKHQIHIEKPVKLDYPTLNQLVTICHNTVRIANNFLFDKIMSRLIVENGRKKTKILWTWNYDTDKEKFKEYYYTFYSRLNPPSNNQTPKKAYEKYHKYYLSL